MKANSILDTVGRTPHVRVARLFPGAPRTARLTVQVDF